MARQERRRGSRGGCRIAGGARRPPKVPARPGCGTPGPDDHDYGVKRAVYL